MRNNIKKMAFQIPNVPGRPFPFLPDMPGQHYYRNELKSI